MQNFKRQSMIGDSTKITPSITKLDETHNIFSENFERIESAKVEEAVEMKEKVNNLNRNLENIQNEEEEEISFKKKTLIPNFQSLNTPSLENNYSAKSTYKDNFSPIEKIAQDSSFRIFNFVKTDNNCLFEFNGQEKNILKLLKKSSNVERYNNLLYGLFVLVILIYLSSNFLNIQYYCNQKLFFSFLTILFTSFVLYIYYQTKELISISISLMKENESVIKISKIFPNYLKNDVLPYFDELNKFVMWNGKIKYFDDENLGQKIILHYENGLKLNMSKTKDINELKIFDCKKENLVISYLIESINNTTRISIFFHLKGILACGKNKNFEKLIKSSSKNLTSLNIILENSKFDLHSKNSIIQLEQKLTQKNKQEEVEKVENRTIYVESTFKDSPSDIESNKNTSANEPEKTEELVDPQMLKYKQLVSQMKQQLIEFSHKNWLVMDENKDYKAYYFDEVSGMRSSKAETIINKPIRTVYEHLQKLEVRGEYDKNFETGHNLEIINENMLINYLKFKGKLFFAPRDLIVFNYTQYNEEKDCIILCKSIESDKYKKIDKIERAEMLMGGAVLRKIDENKTSVTVLTLVDLKLKQFLVNQLLKEIMKSVKFLKEVLEKQE